MKARTLLSTLAGMAALVGFPACPPVSAQIDSPAGIVPAGAHPVVSLEIDGEGIAVEAKAKRQAVQQQCIALTGRSADQFAAILDDAGRFCEIARNQPLGNGRSRVGVRLFLAFAANGRQGLLRALLQAGLLKPLRVAVVLPEEHRIEAARVAVPDPAGETAIARYLEAAGFAGVDPGIAARLRNEETIRAALKGDLSEEELRALRSRQPGFDILVVGEAFSVERRGIATTSGLPACEANVEVKALDLATGARVYSDRERGYGRALSDIGAGKTALEEAGGRLAPRIAEGLLLWLVNVRNATGGGDLVTVRLEISGLGSARQRDAFLDAAKALPGVDEILSSEMEGGVLFAVLRVKRPAASRLAGRLEGLPGFPLRLNGDSGGTIKGSLTKP